MAICDKLSQKAKKKRTKATNERQKLAQVLQNEMDHACWLSLLWSPSEPVSWIAISTETRKSEFLEYAMVDNCDGDWVHGHVRFDVKEWAAKQGLSCIAIFATFLQTSEYDRKRLCNGPSEYQQHRQYSRWLWVLSSASLAAKCRSFGGFV